MKKTPIKIAFHVRDDMTEAKKWRSKIEKWLSAKYPNVEILHNNKVDIVIALGGDGTILEAIRKYMHSSPLFVGLNMGHVGFLATVRQKEKFFEALEIIFSGKYFESKRMMMAVSLVRKGKKIKTGYAFNDTVIQNLTGVGELDVIIGGMTVQHIQGTGVLIATASGTTAHNMSLHGPIVMPDIKCFVVTEVQDHNTPTPPLIIKRNREVIVRVKNFRKRGELLLAKTGEPADMVLFIDGAVAVALEKGDEIHITRTPRLVRLAEIEKDYFFKSLRQKFTFK